MIGPLMHEDVVSMIRTPSINVNKLSFFIMYIEFIIEVMIVRRR